MKKILFAVMALGMSLVSCMNEDFPTPAKGYGYIYVDVNNDPIVQTRASAPVDDLTGWVITANDGENDHDLSTDNKVVAGTYTVSAKSHASMAAALTGWGEAYYEGSVAGVEVTKGAIATPVIDCGKAKNGRIKVSFSLPDVFTDYKVAIEVDGRSNISFDNTTSANAAYFNPGVVEYALTYKYDGSGLKTVNGEITVVAATEHIISISANDNGRINVTVNVDDSFETGTGDSIEFDAATGEEVTNS